MKHLPRHVLGALLLGLLLFTAAPEARADDPAVHVVESGETLYAIALRYGVSLERLIQENGLQNPNLLWVGQRLRLPGSSGGRPAPAPSSGGATPVASRTYAVQPGDTLFGVAARLGVSPWELASLNEIPVLGYLYIGQLLRIPEEGAVPPPRPTPAPPSVATPAPAPGVHLVQAGDTLYGIAARYGVAPSTLAELNGLANPNLLWVGQRLQLPGRTSSPGAAPSPSGSPARPPTSAPPAGRTPTPSPSPAPTPRPTPTTTPSPTPLPYPPPVVPSGEIRGLWVTRWDYKTAADVRHILDRAVQGGFNTVFFQVRGRADAFYRSSLEPWGRELTGTLGRDPGWDPLAVAVEEAHRRGLALQAYINVFPAWSGDTPPGDPSHPYRQHPDWVVVDRQGQTQGLGAHYVFFSPGIAAVQDHVSRVVGEIVRGYAVDGIHLDYVRYPDRDYSHDPASKTRYAALGGGQSWEDWQRQQVTALVRRLHSEVGDLRPGLPLTAAVIPVYTDRWGWKMRDARGYYYQDWYRWAREGYLDQVMPMIYWNRADRPHFDLILDEIVDSVPASRVVVGINGNYTDFGEIAGQIDYARSRGVRGVAIFAYSLLEGLGYWDELRSGPFAR